MRSARRTDEWQLSIGVPHRSLHSLECTGARGGGAEGATSLEARMSRRCGRLGYPRCEPGCTLVNDTLVPHRDAAVAVRGLSFSSFGMVR